MLKLSEFGHNHHPSGVKLLANNIRRGIRALLKFEFSYSKENLHESTIC